MPYPQFYFERALYAASPFTPFHPPPFSRAIEHFTSSANTRRILHANNADATARALLMMLVWALHDICTALLGRLARARRHANSFELVRFQLAYILPIAPLLRFRYRHRPQWFIKTVSKVSFRHTRLPRFSDASPIMTWWLPRHAAERRYRHALPSIFNAPWVSFSDTLMPPMPHEIRRLYDGAGF